MLLLLDKGLQKIHKFYRQIRQDIGLDRTDLRLKKPSNAFFIAAVAWVLEGTILIEYTFEEGTRTYIMHATRVPVLMALCLLYGFGLGGMAVWRRTQYGKFTRGERKLWAKALTAFGVAEFVTALSFVIVYMGMSGGPTPLVYRTFNVSRKGLVLEFLVFSYVLFLAHAAKYLLKGNSGRTQLTLCCVIMCILSYMFGKDVMLLIMRENLYLQSTARGRNIRTNLVIYTLSADGGTQHATTFRSAYSLYPNLKIALSHGTRLELDTFPILSQYNTNNTIYAIHKEPRIRATFPILHYVVNYAAQYDPTQQYVQPNAAYPRRTGFVPKRLAMGQLLMILKMYHHLILVIGGSLYAYRLIFRRKNAYNLLGSCLFNVYCCFILAGVIYLLYIFPRAELFLKLKPHHFNLHRIILRTHESGIHLGRLLCYGNQRTATPAYPLA